MQIVRVSDKSENSQLTLVTSQQMCVSLRRAGLEPVELIQCDEESRRTTRPSEVLRSY